ncbi:MAG: CCA tRNA nucleotidyltransferase [Planctomycetota bacterium]
MPKKKRDAVPSPRRSAVGVVKRLRAEGHVAYLAGGCVRDELLGIEPKDFDVVTDATPERVAELFDRTSLVGAAFGVVLVRHGRGRTTEVATFRTDGEYRDKRRPDGVVFSTPEQDAQRRDFTVNALFLDPLEEDPAKRVIDFVGGRADLEKKLVRAVGDPEQRLAEDHLRALRAVRFACRLDFALERRTGEAIEAYAAELVGVSRERIGEECRKMLGHRRAPRAVNLIHRLGLDGPVLGVEPMGPIGLSVLRAVARHAAFVTSLAAWFLDRGVSVDSAEQIDEAVRLARAGLCLSNKERDALRGALETFRGMRLDWDVLAVAPRKRLMARPGFEDGFRVLAATDFGVAARLQDDFEALARIGGGIRPTPFVTGDDLIEMGAEPGPGFQVWLDELYDRQLDGSITEKDAAMSRARELIGVSGVE